MLIELAIIFALILANGLFSGAEIALVSVRRTRIDELVEAHRRGAKALKAVREQPERLLATIQIGITVISATAAAFGGASFAADLAPVLAEPGAGEHAHQAAMVLVVVGISFLSIVVGELVPKSLALRSAETYALWVARPLLALAWAARPLVWLLTALSNLLLKPFGDRTTFTETRHSTEELHQLLDEATRAGTVDRHAGEIAGRALELPDLTAADVMVPRGAIVSLRLEGPPDELKRVLLEHTHSRLPVCGRSIDDVVGYVSVKDLLCVAWEQRLIVLQDVMRPVHFVPATQPAVELLQAMKTLRNPFAVVIDERGGTAGIVTLEDLLEELVGDITDEHARPAPALIQRRADGALVVSGAAAVRDVNRALGLQLSESGGFKTIAGLCLAIAGRIPAVGELLALPDGPTLEILDASPRRVRAVLIR
jgi:putative hemolysin